MKKNNVKSRRKGYPRNNQCSKKYNKLCKNVQSGRKTTVRLLIPSTVVCREQLHDFASYCVAHPHQRFWQALRNWINVPFLVVQEDLPVAGQEDTFYWRGRVRDES